LTGEDPDRCRRGGADDRVDVRIALPGLVGPGDDCRGITTAAGTLDDADLVPDDADEAAALSGDPCWRPEAGSEAVLGQLLAHELADALAGRRRASLIGPDEAKQGEPDRN
jgi:hypothetical protein